ncbi:hypothetical protein SAMN05428988_4520 [Chitinophaga sp. YR573]|uniref:hypothetical protein n=1 Tax=Chitinophaga sp. YR573 TaxID=1881040 RepID=UPI0008ABA81D|nr:hypothetical protein [Chitinophaga sp. YR573]SEW36591.1 hypothetical protein SAMN05428988_4520 [Chitinophaga sp. YR573]
MDSLKSAWNNAGTEQTDIKIVRPPVLKNIRRQLTIETICYVAFLLVYYNFFDGDKKSFFLNVILVVSVSLLLLHNVAGYMITNNPVFGNNLKQSLTVYLEKLKRYAVIAVASRAIAFSGIMLFFMGNIRWTTGKYYALAFIICLLGIQIFSLWRIWAGRIKKIKGVLVEL